MVKLRQFFIGQHLREDIDLFERAKAIMLFRFLLTFSILFTLPILGDISLNLNKALIKHCFDFVAIIVLLFSLRYFKSINQSITLFFGYSFFTYLLTFMILNPEKIDIIGILWSTFFFSLSALLQRGIARILYCCLLGWIPIFYVIINIQLGGVLTVAFLKEDVPVDSPLFLLFMPIILIITSIWSHTNTINDAKIIISQQKKLLQEKNKDITDSIKYAKRIQQSKLPSRIELTTLFPDSFILFKPKDIVSGDFYYFRKTNNSTFIAAADCTGHGVPGAIMSMICSEKLEEAISISKDTSEILSITNKGVKYSLKQTDSDESTRDGMDIVLCSVDKVNNTINYAGANRPLWIIRKGMSAVEEIKATKKSIGGLTEDNQHFEPHEIKLQQGDIFYIFTDGYADQFGEKTGKKIMTKKLKEILVEMHNQTMQEQARKLEMYLDNWKGNLEQVDDVLIIGIRL